MSNNIVEIVTFKLAHGVSEQDFVQANKAFSEFIHKQPGLLYRSVAKQNDADVYVDVVYWQSQEDAKKVEQMFYDSPECKSFMQVIDKDSVMMTHNLIIEQTQCNG